MQLLSCNCLARSASVTAFKLTLSKYVCKQIFHDNAELHDSMTIDLTCQLFQDVHMHALFDVTGCCIMAQIVQYYADWPSVARSKMKESTL